MRRVLLLTLVFIIRVSGYAQSFIITPLGLTSAADSSRHYVVITADSTSAGELYKRAYIYIMHTWNNPDFTDSGKVEGELLHVKCHAADAIVSRGNLGMKMYLNLGYTLKLDFKEGKVKYEIADLKINTTADNGTSNSFYIPYTKGLVWCLYNKDGSVPKKEQATKDQLEKYFNDQLKEMIAVVKPAPKPVPAAVPVPRKDDF